MATSSFSKKFVIDNPKEVEKLIYAMENPTPVVLSKPKVESAEERKDFLCQLKKRIHSMNS